IERAVMDLASRFNDLALRLTRLVQVDLHGAWEQMGEMTSAILKRELAGVPAEAGNPHSNDPEDWPLAVLEQKLAETKAALDKAQTTLKESMKSPTYVARKKMAAGWLSMIFGVTLALIGSLRLFEPLGVDVTGWFKEPFNVIDMVLSGILMGLGTDWVHQVIGVIIQGKGFLGRAGGGTEIDVNVLRAQTEAAVEEIFRQQVDRFRDEAEERLRDITRPPSSPT
ncbi:MAG: hypothetical protein JW910_19390, partial [Anaerolineae bacterium]|nr:hypothetical protein [Anaerolineae bacterium]